jgi:phosphate transport system substrate-binding protein
MGGIQMKKVLLIVLVVSMFLISFAETLVIKGSNTVFPVSQLWIEELQKIYPEMTITLEGAGSSTGIAGLFNETADIGNSSRYLKSSEIQKMLEDGKYIIPIVFGYDGIAVIVHKDLGIDNISSADLKRIYAGEISTWNQLNPNLPRQRIVVYSRNTASGTYETFSEKIMNKDRMAASVRMVESTQAEINAIATNRYAIGYAGVGYVTQDVKVLTVDGVYPTKTDILGGIYPISRPLFFFIEATNQFPSSGPIKKYIDFGLSKRGQELVEQAGYVAAYGF